MALHYVGRYSTTRAKLTDYLRRKVGERGWSADHAPPIAATVEHCVDAGYIDEEAYAQIRAAGLARRGYGNARVSQTLRAAGIARDTVVALTPSEVDAYAAAERFAQRRRIGRYGTGTADAVERRRQFAAMIRAGHSFDVARHFVQSDPDSEGEDPHKFPLRNDT